jgi:hypothetical protein
VDVQTQTKPCETCHNLIFVCKKLKQYCKLRTNKNHNKPFFHDQILFLFINYPSGCNLPTLCVTGSWGWMNNVWHRHELPFFLIKELFISRWKNVPTSIQQWYIWPLHIMNTKVSQNCTCFLGDKLSSSFLCQTCFSLPYDFSCHSVRVGVCLMSSSWCFFYNHLISGLAHIHVTLMVGLCVQPLHQ